jgi:hypothetical protein
MPDDAQVRFVAEKRMPASARVLNQPIALRDGDDVVAEESAKIANLLPEQQRVRVRIAVGLEQERVSALNADVLVIAVAGGKALVGVMAEEARQRVTDSRG